MKKIGSVFLSLIILLSTLTLPSVADARDPIKPACNSVEDRGTAIVSTNTSPTPILSWGINFTSLGATVYGSPITVSSIYGSVTKPDLSVRIIPPGTIYAPHTFAWNYLFHGSISNYNYGSSSSPLASGDIIHLRFDVDGPTSVNSVIDIECRIP
ncbi:hypothetical protein [Paenibacillus jilunlii]|uniref:Uncharacterized protein n=1 Tax=Paenibacillus jilunlii TaxID=682956 RepID=A0A1G9GG51_9BACL|nr:hypothetical protein [Paenibacillus jilunlii]SDK99669.1 hypothetical protein SAMN05216191_101393 [Paenibacillus jilunlii]